LPAAQVKRLCFLQAGEFQRLGRNQSLKANLRLFSATHRDQDEKIWKGALREGLFFWMKIWERIERA
jgi:DNA-binding NtrC family response regulator